jgi:hypothetical protein
MFYNCATWTLIVIKTKETLRKFLIRFLIVHRAKGSLPLVCLCKKNLSEVIRLKNKQTEAYEVSVRWASTTFLKNFTLYNFFHFYNPNPAT